MKRRIEDLGLHEAIHLIADKYSKNVCKNAKRENMNYGYIIRDFYRDNFFSWVRDIEGRYPIITAVYPASEFKNKPKKLRLDKIEERLTKLENSQPLSVTDNGNGDYTITGDLFKAKKLFEKYVSASETVLTELPEKWCVRDCEEVSKWAKKNKGYSTDEPNPDWYWHSNVPVYEGFYENLQEGYTEITTEQFKKWVLGEGIELQVGKWYKASGNKIICFITEINESGLKCYGFNYDGIWTSECGWFIGILQHAKDILTPATEQEVSDALIAEAKRRGFKTGYASGGYEYFIQKGDFFYKNIENKLYVNQNADAWNLIFHNGVWAPLKETEIDWSAVKLVQANDGEGEAVFMILELNDNNTFKGVCVIGDEITNKYTHSDNWDLKDFKPYTGEPITLTP